MWNFLAPIATSALTGLATNFIGGLLGGGNRQAPQAQMPQVPQLSYQDALAQAGDIVNPIYDQQIERNMRSVDNNNIARGFYGQMPGDAVKMSALGDMERGRAGQMANLAQQMMSQQQNFGLQQQQLGLQQQGMNMQRGQNMWGNIGNLANMGINAYMNHHNAAGSVPFPWMSGLQTGSKMPGAQVGDAFTALQTPPVTLNSSRTLTYN